MNPATQEHSVGARREDLLRVEDLRVHFGTPAHPVRAVDGVTFSMAEGETMALVGESGCGKSLTALALTRLVPEPTGRYAGGRVLWRGASVLDQSEGALRRLRGREIAYVFQEPGVSLNPLMRLGSQLAEAVRRREGAPRRGAAVRAEAAALLEQAGVSDPVRRLDAWPHELSGGLQQRAMIAMALACRPRLLVADEPTTALDVTVQAQILELLARLRETLGMAVLLITHNLGLVRGFADRLGVMYAGRLVEQGPAAGVIAAPRHPYTAALLAAMPRLETPRGGRVEGIPGAVPDPACPPAGCRFHPRCPRARPDCAVEEPPETPSGAARTVRCFYPL